MCSSKQAGVALRKQLHVAGAVHRACCLVLLFNLPRPAVVVVAQAHIPVIEQRGATQRHFDILVSMLVSSLHTCGAPVRGRTGWVGGDDQLGTGQKSSHTESARDRQRQQQNNPAGVQAMQHANQETVSSVKLGCHKPAHIVRYSAVLHVAAISIVSFMRLLPP